MIKARCGASFSRLQTPRTNKQIQFVRMKEAVVDKATEVTIRDVDIPVAQPGQVLIKVVVSGTNPKDWKLPAWLPDAPAANQGDDIAGHIEAVGEGVSNFKKGDRVAAFHEMVTPAGSYAEYAIAWAHTTFHIPDKTSFEGMWPLQSGSQVCYVLTNINRGCFYSARRDDIGLGSVSKLELASSLAPR